MNKDNRIEVFRQRLSGRKNDEKKGWPLKDRLTALGSLIAFTISLASAYVTLIRQADDLSVALNGPIIAGFLSDTDFHVKVDISAAFINSGNRSSAVMQAWLYVLQQPPKPKEDCVGDARLIGLDIVQFVIRPGEISAKEIRMSVIKCIATVCGVV